MAGGNGGFTGRFGGGVTVGGEGAQMLPLQTCAYVAVGCTPRPRANAVAARTAKISRFIGLISFKWMSHCVN